MAIGGERGVVLSWLIGANLGCQRSEASSVLLSIFGSQLAIVCVGGSRSVALSISKGVASFGRRVN